MTKTTIDDVFKALTKPLPDFKLKPGKTAVVLIDMQVLVSQMPFWRKLLQLGCLKKR